MLLIITHKCFPIYPYPPPPPRILLNYLSMPGWDSTDKFTIQFWELAWRVDLLYLCEWRDHYHYRNWPGISQSMNFVNKKHNVNQHVHYSLHSTPPPPPPPRILHAATNKHGGQDEVRVVMETIHFVYILSVTLVKTINFLRQRTSRYREWEDVYTWWLMSKCEGPWSRIQIKEDNL